MQLCGLVSRIAMGFVAVIASLGVATAAEALRPPGGYFLIEPAQPTSSGNKVEVIEAFSYSCSHCAELEPLVEEWQRKIDRTSVDFKRLHVTISLPMRWLATGFYTTEALKQTDQVHAAVFREIHENKFNPGRRTVEDLAALYSRVGISAEAFTRTAASPAVESMLKDVDVRQRSYKLDRTPTFVVAGKYRVTAESAGGEKEIFQVIDRLVQRERAEMRSSSQTRR